MLPPRAARRGDLRRAIFCTSVGRLERAIDQATRRLVAAQVPVLRVAEHDGDDDLRLLGGRVSDEPRVLHVERLGPGQRAGLAGDADRLAAAERARGAAELAGRLHHPADGARDVAGNGAALAGRSEEHTSELQSPYV